jgi:hypothetical protein
MMHLKLVEKQEQAKPQISSQEEIINIKAEIDEMESGTVAQAYNPNYLGG